MFRDERLEMKVGLFIGIGIFVMFLIVFSINDLNFLRDSYTLNIVFDYVNGITENAPVRIAGVHSGEVQKIKLFSEEETGKTRVNINVAIDGRIKLKENSVARINTLGLLGEQYLEITPGFDGKFLKNEDVIIGQNPANVGKQMEDMGVFIDSASLVMKDISEGKGSLGKFVTDDTLYNELNTIFGKMSRGEGTLGRLLNDDAIFRNVEEFTSDIKAHPWKLLSKPRTSDR